MSVRTHMSHLMHVFKFINTIIITKVMPMMITLNECKRRQLSTLCFIFFNWMHAVTNVTSSIMKWKFASSHIAMHIELTVKDIWYILILMPSTPICAMGEFNATVSLMWMKEIWFEFSFHVKKVRATCAQIFSLLL